MISRRGFLGSILALGAAPAIVRADALMKVIPRETVIAEPEVLTLARLKQIRREILAHAIPPEVLYGEGFTGSRAGGIYLRGYLVGDARA